MELKKLDKKVRTLWFIENLAVVILLLTAYVIVLFAVEQAYRLIVGLSVGIPLGLLIVFLLVYPLLRYAYYSYGYSDIKIIIKKGVVFRSNVVIPVKQIQDIHIYEGPIMLLMKLGGVSISTAGSNFNIACIDKAQAQKMVDELEEYLEKRLEAESDEEI